MQLDPESPSPLLLHRCLRRFCLLKCHRDGSPLFLPLLLLYQRGSSGKNRWKCEEESGDTRTIPSGYQSRKGRYDAAEDETHSVVPPAKVLHSGNIKSDSDRKSTRLNSSHRC